jgi:hypothetical protein
MCLLPRNLGGYPKGYPPPEGEMAGWKEALPADEVLAFRSTRYKYLVHWKGFLLKNLGLLVSKPES